MSLLFSLCLYLPILSLYLLPSYYVHGVGRPFYVSSSCLLSLPYSLSLSLSLARSLSLSLFLFLIPPGISTAPMPSAPSSTYSSAHVDLSSTPMASSPHPEREHSDDSQSSSWGTLQDRQEMLDKINTLVAEDDEDEEEDGAIIPSVLETDFRAKRVATPQMTVLTPPTVLAVVPSLDEHPFLLQKKTELASSSSAASSSSSSSSHHHHHHHSATSSGVGVVLLSPPAPPTTTILPADHNDDNNDATDPFLSSSDSLSSALWAASAEPEPAHPSVGGQQQPQKAPRPQKYRIHSIAASDSKTQLAAVVGAEEEEEDEEEDEEEEESSDDDEEKQTDDVESGLCVVCCVCSALTSH